MDADRYTLLIIDDEPIIADGLQLLFEELAEPALQTYAAYSSAEALERFEQVRPDIVLLDIKMPGVTGLELSSQLKKLDSDIKIIFLTGYGQFEYAYKAIKQDAFDYILKTEGDDKVIATVKHAVARIRRERELFNEYSVAKTRLSNMLPVFKYNLLLAILTGQLSGVQEMKDAMAEVDECLHPNQHVLIVLGCSPGKQLSLAAKGVVQLTVEQILSAHIQSAATMIASVHYMEDICWFIVLKESSFDLLVLTSLLEDTQFLLKEKTGSAMSFATAKESASWNGVNDKYQALRRVMTNNALYENEGIIVEGFSAQEDSLDTNDREERSEYINLNKKMEILETYLKTGQYDKFKEFMTGICSFLSGNRHNRSFYALEVYFAVGKIFTAYINQNGLSQLIANRVDLSLLFNPDNMNDWIDRARFLSCATEAICSVAAVKQQVNAETTIARIKDHIHNNLSADLSLTYLGKITGFNPTYLSRLFKREAGTGLHEYISECRIELAKSLLTGTKLKIYEIGQKCGYDNSNYFIKTFKTVVELTPQEFRSQYEKIRG